MSGFIYQRFARCVTQGKTMNKLSKLTIPVMLRTSFERYSTHNSLVFVDEKPKLYKDLKLDIDRVGRLLKTINVTRGSKVAILSTNMPNWGVAYFATAAIGAVVVPILPDFHANEIKNILSHAEVETIFISDNLLSKLKISDHPSLKMIRMEDFSMLSKPIEMPDNNEPFEYTNVDEEDLLSIIYTSGTTGTSKGVMLTHKNIVWNAQQCLTFQYIDTNDRFLSVLPLSHTFENTICLIFPIMFGATVYYLKKPPTPSVLLPAFASVKPTMLLTVPLIIEKIYKGKILPEINRKLITKYLYRMAPFRKILNQIAGKKLFQTFGGELRFIGIGGAKLDNSVERFLMDAKFPLAIGYGLTETSPLLAGAVGDNIRYKSTGIPLEGVKIRLSPIDNKINEGEIEVMGENIMKGYYKEPELTKEVFASDGWFKTGDLGRIDKDGFLYIKGRIKNMIVGASGENIYPEEIESVINRMEYVLESLVVEQKGRLVALVHLNMDEIEQGLKQLKVNAINKISTQVDDILSDIQENVNNEVNKFSRIQLVILQATPFEKTPTQKIKRFLYH